MKPLRILYLGFKSGTALDRARAYERLGHQVTHVDLRSLLPRTAWVDRITWHLGGDLLGPWMVRALPRALGDRDFDLCHVESGEWVTPAVIRVLRRFAPKVINYNIDDPLGPRDGPLFRAYRRAVPHYDLLVVMREQNVAEAEALGARKVLWVFRSADELSHAPRALTDEDHRRWDCDVLFLGTWMPERGPFLRDLIRRGVPLTIQGSHWQKAPEWSELKQAWRGNAIAGDDYAKAIQCARINLGLLSKGNRDLHTTRSLEIPALGALFCAERTPEHLLMYREGEEAAFWSDAEECAKVCQQLLASESARQLMAARGRARLVRNGHLNEPTLKRILTAAGARPTAVDLPPVSARPMNLRRKAV